ncbi:MAG: rane integrity-associated transporter subunit PqiC [Prosthecobacter sp.]|nr:rane integrity-associated transporter subunit PqiC [Prosthecobacter sp.]
MKTLALLLPLLLASCGVIKPVKDTSVNHLLDPIIPEHPITGATPAIAITRPALPSYLDRQQLVSRSADGEMQMNTNHIWAEPLDSAISRVTALNLGRLRNSLNIQPVENFVTMDYQTVLEIRVTRFELDTSHNLVLECTWKLQPVAGHLSLPHTFTTTIPVSPIDPGMKARVAAMNEALARLARNIAGRG